MPPKIEPLHPLSCWLHGPKGEWRGCCLLLQKLPLGYFLGLSGARDAPSYANFKVFLMLLLPSTLLHYLAPSFLADFEGFVMFS